MRLDLEGLAKEALGVPNDLGFLDDQHCARCAAPLGSGARSGLCGPCRATAASRRSMVLNMAVIAIPAIVILTIMAAIR